MQAFEQGAIDYLVKPVDPGASRGPVQRLKERLARAAGAAARAPRPCSNLAEEMRRRATPRAWLQWIKTPVGTSVRLIPVEQVAFLRSDEKYTLVAWDGGEALIRKTIRELAGRAGPLNASRRFTAR